MDVVDTAADAADLQLPPLLVREPLEEFLDAHGIGEGRLEAERIGDGHSNITFLVTTRRRARGAAAPASSSAAPLRARRAARGAAAEGARGHARARSPGDRGRRRRGPAGRALLRDGGGTRERARERDPAGARHARGAPPHRGGAGGRAGGGALRGLARLRPRGLRQAHGLPRAPGAPLQRALGAQQDARAAGGGGARRVARAQHARIAGVDDRARRLPARQRDDGRPRAGRAGGDLRLGAVDDRRPACGRGLPDRDLGRARRPGGHDVRQPERGHARRRLPDPRGDDRALRGEERPLDVGAELVPGARALEGRRVHGGQLQALPVRQLGRRVPGRCSIAACPCSPRRPARSPAHEGPAGGLRRRAHHQRLRLLPRVLRGRGPRPRDHQGAVSRGPARARERARARARRPDGGAVRGALRRAARAGRRSGAPGSWTACSGTSAPTTRWSRRCGAPARRASARG